MAQQPRLNQGTPSHQPLHKLGQHATAWHLRPGSQLAHQPCTGDPMRPARPARCRYSAAVGGTPTLYTWLQQWNRRQCGGRSSRAWAGGKHQQRGRQAYEHSTGLLHCCCCCCCCCRHCSCLLLPRFASAIQTRPQIPPPPPHTHSHPFSARTPDRRQVEAARRRGRGQQQRGAVVPERVQRLDGLGALGQQHCSKGGGMMALVPAVGARGGRRSAAVPAVGTAPAAHPSPLPPCNRLRTALLAACP